MILQSWDLAHNKGEIEMLEIIFVACMLWVFGKLFFFGLKAAWGLAKILPRAGWVASLTSSIYVEKRTIYTQEIA